VLAAALVEFLVAAAILFAVLQDVVRHHRQLLTGRQQLQTQWLAQAGVDRAMAQLRKSADYRGETWRVPPDELDGVAAAEVKIRLENVADQPDDLRLTVDAQYPTDSIHSSQQTREAIIHLK
jgi:type II secretory pathway component PulK